VAAESGISKTSVQRCFQLFGSQPHRTESFMRSNGSFFTEKLRDLIGPYLSPPHNALAVCVDEKSHCQAAERTQTMQPFGHADGAIHAAALGLDHQRAPDRTALAARPV
jgi:putative transposase